jgi:hypothetical protein
VEAELPYPVSSHSAEESSVDSKSTETSSEEEEVWSESESSQRSDPVEGVYQFCTRATTVSEVIKGVDETSLKVYKANNVSPMGSH